MNTSADRTGSLVNTKDQAVQSIIQEYKEMFTGLGKIKNHTVKVKIDREAIPHAQPKGGFLFIFKRKVSMMKRIMSVTRLLAVVIVQVREL